MKRKSRKKERKPGIWAALIVALVFLCFLGWMMLKANTVTLMRATVKLEDLPPAFEGRTLLYVADIDIGGLNTAAKSASVINRMRALKPDILLLGGDYTSHTLLQILNGDTSINDDDLRALDEFFHYISDFEAPLGRFALASSSDGSGLYEVLEATGFEMLNDSRHCVTLGDDKLWLVGVTQETENVRKGGKLFRSGECVIALSDTPECFPIMNTVEASDGGHWVDLCLAGHTHGGQVNIAGRSMLPLTSMEQHYLYGWTRETGVPMLTTSGLGCEGVNLRLNTQPEIWFITLTAKD